MEQAEDDSQTILTPYPVGAVRIMGVSQEAKQYEGSAEVSINQEQGVVSFDNYLTHGSPPSISVAEFVIHKFIPDCLAHRRSSARSHFRTVLNHVLHPESVSKALSTPRGGARRTLTTIPGWPYVDTLQLREVDASVIHRLTHAALQRGYSTQMARQIRNVMSLIMSHAIRAGYYMSPNPASFIPLPAEPKKERHVLDLAQLEGILRMMVYPEKHISLLLLLAELRVTEICGLQWKYVNLSPSPRLVEGEIIPSKTIAVRNQTYRGEFTKLHGSRRRFVRIPDLLCSVLREARAGQRFTGPDDFVLASRNGTPIHPENIAARRLRSIGRSLGLPWLSWSALVRTRNCMRSQSGRALYDHLERILTPSKQSAMLLG